VNRAKDLILAARHPVPELDEPEQDAFYDFVDRKYYGGQDWADYRDYGNSAQLNWSLARRLSDQGHFVALFGAEPEVMDEIGSQAPGLDWMLVDGRWLVDAWSKVYLGAPKSVYDLDDPSDKAQVGRRYPPREKWELAYSNSGQEHKLPQDASVFTTGTEDWKEFYSE
jgi:hypothetical protein